MSRVVRPVCWAALVIAAGVGFSRLIPAGSAPAPAAKECSCHDCGCRDCVTAGKPCACANCPATCAVVSGESKDKGKAKKPCAEKACCK